MPLMILGLLFLTSLLIFSIVRYMTSVDTDTRSVRDRYPHAFKSRPDKDEGTQTADPAGDNSDYDEPIDAESYVDSDSLRGDIDYMIRNLREDLREKANQHGIDLDGIRESFGRGRKDAADEDQTNEKDDDPNKTIIFPTDNVEAEKNKRNIH